MWRNVFMGLWNQCQSYKIRKATVFTLWFASVMTDYPPCLISLKCEFKVTSQKLKLVPGRYSYLCRIHSVSVVERHQSATERARVGRIISDPWGPRLWPGKPRWVHLWYHGVQVSIRSFITPPSLINSTYLSFCAQSKADMSCNNPSKIGGSWC